MKCLLKKKNKDIYLAGMSLQEFQYFYYSKYLVDHKINEEKLDELINQFKIKDLKKQSKWYKATYFRYYQSDEIFDLYFIIKDKCFDFVDPMDPFKDETVNKDFELIDPFIIDSFSIK